METGVDSSRRTAASILSISTSSSRASEGYDSDVERSEKTGTRLSRRTVPSAGGMRDRSPGRDTPQPVGNRVERKREFKGRHIQMMAIGNPFSFSYNIRRHNWSRSTLSVWRDFVSIWPCLNFYCIHFDGHRRLLRVGRSHTSQHWAIQITLGEMISYLPLPGGFSTLANRLLSPVIVRLYSLQVNLRALE